MLIGKSETPAQRAWRRPLALLLSTFMIFLVAAAGSVAADSAARAKISVSPQDAIPGAIVTVSGSGFPARADGRFFFFVRSTFEMYR